MDPQDIQGRPARELSDEELERQGTHAHATRNWVFLHGTAEQFARHTERMLELEQEYLRRHPKRTWQGSAEGAGAAPLDEATMLRAALRGIVRQVEAALERADVVQPGEQRAPVGDPAAALLTRVAAAPGGRLHKLEAQQAARQVGLDRAALARLYTSTPPLLATEAHDRVITAAGREYVARAASEQRSQSGG